MNKLVAILPIVVCINTHGQGFINVQNPIDDYYRIEHIEAACDPNGSVLRVRGEAYTAELWYALGASRPQERLIPIAGAQGSFTTSGFPRLGSPALVGTFGGDIVTLQLRVWENRAGTVSSWAEALAATDLASGVSTLINYPLGGVMSDGVTPVLAKNLAHLLPGFTISAVCPEPSSYLLLALGAGCGVLMRRRSAGGTTRARAQD